MKARVKFLSNGQEIDRAKELGLPEPEKEYTEDDFYFDIEKIAAFNISGDGRINLHFLCDDGWTINFDQKIWDRLVERDGS